MGRAKILRLARDNRVAWRASTPIDWANESYLIAVSPEVGYCVRTDTGCCYGEHNERLDDGEPNRTVEVDRLYVRSMGTPYGSA